MSIADGGWRRGGAVGACVCAVAFALVGCSNTSAPNTSVGAGTGPAGQADANAAPGAPATPPKARQIRLATSRAGSASFKGGGAVTVGHEVWITNPAAANLVFFSPADRSSADMAADGPNALAATATTAYVGEQNDLNPRLRAVDIASHKPGATAKLPALPRAVGLVDDEVWVLSAASVNGLGSSVISRFAQNDLSARTPVHLDGFQGALVVSGANTYVLGGRQEAKGLEITKLDRDGATQKRVPVRGGVDLVTAGFALSAAHGQVFVGSYDDDKKEGLVTALDADSLDEHATFSLGQEMAYSISPGPDDLLFVSIGEKRSGKPVPDMFSIAAFDLRADPADASAVIGADDLKGQPGQIAFQDGKGYLAMAAGTSSPILELTWGPRPAPQPNTKSFYDFEKLLADSGKPEVRGLTVFGPAVGADTQYVTLARDGVPDGVAKFGYDSDADALVFMEYSQGMGPGCNAARDDYAGDLKLLYCA